MATSLLFQTIDQLSREKGIDLEIVVGAVEDAILVAARKYYQTDDDLLSQFNRDTGVVEVFAVKKVLETVTDPTKEISLEDARKHQPEINVEEELRIPLPTDVLGRIAAQTAKQVIFQKVREAERESVQAEYSQRSGELVNCMVKRTEGPDLIVDMGRTEGRLPRREQSRLESYQIGDRIRVIIVEVDRAARGPQVIVSRVDPILVQRLFEMEVPEIYDGTVIVKMIAREAGERTKIAVLSRQNDVDCVGACVGMKGSRVQSIIRELQGEKIDIIQYDEDPLKFAGNAISPAKVNHVSVADVEERRLEIVVEDTQLSLAIGRKGQNVRLAAKLLGWHVDIKSEEEKRREVEIQMAALTRSGTSVNALESIGKKTLKKLIDHDIDTVEGLAQTTPAELMKIPGVGDKTVEKIRQAVADFFEQVQEETAPEPETETAEVEAGSESADETAESPTPEGEAEPTVAAAETETELESAPLEEPEKAGETEMEVETAEPAPETDEIAEAPDVEEPPESAESEKVTAATPAEDSVEEAETESAPGGEEEAEKEN
ncbi:MAG: transcription termination factor NusA [Acidobacteria bacterium]|nr:transcription termination factor NusA [Acidobacteriota bacterium]